MTFYRRVVRLVFALIFVCGGVSHLFLGRVQPEGYAVFADTALIPWLRSLWLSFVMPNIGVLTVLLAVFQIACGIGLLWSRTAVASTWAMVGFLVFITVVGYGFPTETLGEDILKNRLITTVMAAVLVFSLRGGAATDLLPVFRLGGGEIAAPKPNKADRDEADGKEADPKQP